MFYWITYNFFLKINLLILKMERWKYILIDELTIIYGYRGKHCKHLVRTNRTPIHVQGKWVYRVNGYQYRDRQETEAC